MLTRLLAPTLDRREMRLVARRPDEQQIIVCRRQYTDYSALSAAREENNAFKTANTGGERNKTNARDRRC